MFTVHDGLPVLVQVGLLTARQLQEGGQAVQVGHFVEGAQQEVHHHQTHEQVDCGERETAVSQQLNVKRYFSKESLYGDDFS